MKPIVIAGNGPSLAKIDYSRLPQDFDVFRCNQFYFEDKYFLGKKIKGVFFNPCILTEQIFTLYHIQERGEYEVDDIYCQRSKNEKVYIQQEKMEDIFPNIKSTFSFLEQIPQMFFAEKFYRLFFRKTPTMGIVMLYTAIAQGYKEIYLTGIDFYRGGGIDYAFDINPHGQLARKMPIFADKNFRDKSHNEEVDLLFLRLALKMENIKIFSVSPNTVLAEIVPLSSIQNDSSHGFLEKPKDYISDLMQPPKYPTSFKQKLKKQGMSRDNLYIKIVYDFVRVCQAILRSFKR